MNMLAAKRKPNPRLRANLADFPGTIVEADLRDEDAFARAIAGFDD